MTLTLSDLDATDRRVVEGLGTIELHHAVRVVLPSGIEVGTDDIREMVCGHDKWRQITHDLTECSWCGRIEPV